MNKNYLIIVLLFFCSILNAQNLNIVYIGNSITEGALLKNPKTEAVPIRASQYLDKHLNGKVTFRNCGVSGMTTLNFLPISGQQFPNVKTAASELAQREGQLLFSISLGTNDSACTMAFGAPVLPEEYYTNMKAIIDELLALYPQYVQRCYVLESRFGAPEKLLSYDRKTNGTLLHHSSETSFSRFNRSFRLF